jgi:hypothetical protein
MEEFSRRFEPCIQFTPLQKANDSPNRNPFKINFDPTLNAKPGAELGLPLRIGTDAAQKLRGTRV